MKVQIVVQIIFKCINVTFIFVFKFSKAEMTKLLTT